MDHAGELGRPELEPAPGAHPLALLRVVVAHHLGLDPLVGGGDDPERGVGRVGAEVLRGRGRDVGDFGPRQLTDGQQPPEAKTARTGLDPGEGAQRHHNAGDGDEHEEEDGLRHVTEGDRHPGQGESDGAEDNGVALREMPVRLGR